ncbi:MAG: amino-acid N-acetyltransferase [Thiothrix sp.]|nr:amino-acid N-acetyltransferase [Thiothrix sp.]
MHSKPNTDDSSLDNDAILRVNFLREASPYVRKHRDRIFVIAFPGDVIELGNFRRIIQDIAIIAALGTRLVLVHGTRPQIDERLQELGLEPEFHAGIRITDKLAQRAAQEACGYVRIQIETLLSFALSHANSSSDSQSIASGNYVTARPMGVLDGVDYGYSGTIRRIQTAHIRRQLESGHIVLLSPIGYSPAGEAYNLRYEQLAVETAQALEADKVLLLGEAPANLPGSMTLEEAYQYQDDHPQMATIIETLQNKVGRIHLLDARIDGALLLELYTRDGIGSMIAANPFETIRAARIDDIQGILEIIRPLEQRGTLVKRSREQLELEINNFLVAERDHQIIGCAALYDTDEVTTGELACLVVHPDYRTSRRGEQLLQAIIRNARRQGKTHLLALSTQTSDWFTERGFVRGTVEELPANKKQLYNFRRNSRIFFKKI